MPSKLTRLWVVPALCLTVWGACGDDDDQTATDASRDRSLGEVQAEVISDLYESGQLGPKEQVLAEMRNFAEQDPIVDEETGLPDVAATHFFNPPPPEGDGAILPYREMTPEQRGTFHEWLTYEARDNPVAREALQEAELQYRDR